MAQRSYRVILLLSLVIALYSRAQETTTLVGEYRCEEKPLSFTYKFADNFDTKQGFVTPYLYSFQGLPAGMTTNGATISGIPKSAGEFKFSITITDAQNSSVKQDFKMVVTSTMLVKIYAILATEETDKNIDQNLTSMGDISVRNMDVSKDRQTAIQRNVAQKEEKNPITSASSQIPSFPTGTSPDFIPSLLPQQIQSYQYRYQPKRDAYYLSPAQVQKQTIFNRQIDANKAIANLLSIIATLTSTLNGLQQDIPKVDENLNAIYFQHKQVQEVVTDIEMQLRNIEMAVLTKNNEIIQLKYILSRTQKEIDEIIRTKDESTKNSTEENDFSKGLNQKIEKAQADLDVAMDNQKQASLALQKATQQIDTYSSRLIKIQTDIATSPQIRIQKRNERIAQLRKLLQKETDDLRAAEAKRTYYQNIQIEGKKQIIQIQGQIKTAQSDIVNKIRPKMEETGSKVKVAQESLNALKSKAEESRSRCVKLTNSAKELGQKIETKQKYLKDVEARITLMVQKYSSIKTQQTQLESLLLEFRHKLKDINQRINNMRSSKESLTQKYTVTQEQLKIAKANLQKAKIEKQSADAAVQQQIKLVSKTTVLIQDNKQCKTPSQVVVPDYWQRARSGSSKTMDSFESRAVRSICEQSKQDSNNNKNNLSRMSRQTNRHCSRCQK